MRYPNSLSIAWMGLTVSGWIVLASGCTSQRETASSSSESKSPSIVRRTDEAPSAHEPADGPPLPGQPERLPETAQVQSGKVIAAELERWTELARQSEARFDYALAAETWQRVVDRLSSTIGPESWQTKNARLARDFARQVAAWDSRRVNELKSVADLNAQAAKSRSDGNIGQSLAQARSALNTLQSLVPENTAIIAKQWIEIGVLESQSGQSDQAKKHLLRGLTIYRDLGIDTHPDLERAHAGLAAQYFAQQLFRPAIANQRAAARIAGQIKGEDSVDYALQANQLGVIYHRAGELDTALRILRASEAIRRLHLGPDDPQVGHSRYNIGIVLMEMKRMDEALNQFKQAEQIFARNRPRLSRAIADCQSQMATIYMLDGHFQLAESLLDQAVSELKQTKGVKPVDIATFEYRLAISLCKQGKYRRAQPLLEHAFDWQQSHLGKDHPDTQKTRQAYALLLQRTKQAKAPHGLRP